MVHIKQKIENSSSSPVLRVTPVCVCAPSKLSQLNYSL